MARQRRCFPATLLDELGGSGTEVFSPCRECVLCVFRGGPVQVLAWSFFQTVPRLCLPATLRVNRVQANRVVAMLHAKKHAEGQ